MRIFVAHVRSHAISPVCQVLVPAFTKVQVTTLGDGSGE